MGAQLCDGECHPQTSTASVCPVLSNGIVNYGCTDYSCESYARNYPAACYCYQRMTAELAANGVGLKTLNKLEDEEGDLCYTILTDYVLARSIAAGATGVIVFVNFVLKVLIPKFAASEHHSSSTGEVKGVFMKVRASEEQAYAHRWYF